MPDAPVPLAPGGESPPPDDPPTDGGSRGKGASSEELGALITLHRPALQACARKLCRNHFDADDVLQDAIVRALQCKSTLRDRDKARSWLIAILNSTFVDWVRRRKASRMIITSEFEMPDPAVDELTEPLPWEDISNDEIRAAVACLPEDVRVTYTLFALEGRSYAEIAARLKIAKPTVGSRIHRARLKLRALLAVFLKGMKS